MARTTRAAAAKANAAIVAEPKQLSSPPATPIPSTKKVKAKSSKASQSGESRDRDQSRNPSSGLKRSRVSVKQETQHDELPHNLGTAPLTPGGEAADKGSPSSPWKRQKQNAHEPRPGGATVKAELARDQEELATKPATGKKDKYGRTPGVSPYPDYSRPTPEECREVVRLLEKTHGKVVAPKAIPPPSLNISGCGEVPSVLDALIRTLLSAATTNKNSSTAFQGLVSRFGVLDDGIGKGSVDWDAVRQAPQEEVFKAIERGGLARVKSKNIKLILQMVYDENQERKSALTQHSEPPPGSKHESESEKKHEIVKAEQNVISLDHLHLLSTEEAIDKMVTYPGIGAKTASCVALFCLQRPSFAVDTHVFRLCQYLGWVPKTAKKGQPKVDRNTTYSHCDVRIPDDLKYPLHQLLIKHGKTCPRCRAATGSTSASWEDGCPIEHLVKRHGAKKGGISTADRKKAKAAAGIVGEDDDVVGTAQNSSESELSDYEEDP